MVVHVLEENDNFCGRHSPSENGIEHIYKQYIEKELALSREMQLKMLSMDKNPEAYKIHAEKSQKLLGELTKFCQTAMVHPDMASTLEKLQKEKSFTSHKKTSLQTLAKKIQAQDGFSEKDKIVLLHHLKARVKCENYTQKLSRRHNNSSSQKI